ncbi:hypothetical protein D3C73_1096720 [compost metagenome]
MADVAVALDHRVTVRETVHYAGVLHVGTLFQDDPPEVAAQAGQRPDITVRPDDHVTDQDGRGVNVGSWINHRGQAIEAVASHGRFPFEAFTKRCRFRHILYHITFDRTNNKKSYHLGNHPERPLVGTVKSRQSPTK